MIENLQDELYQLESKQAKGTKLRANIRQELEGEKCSNIFFKVLEGQSLQSQTISELCIDDKIQTILIILRTFSNLQKKL